MNEESTRDLPNKESFEERVFARFDAFNARFDSVDSRFDTVDARLEKLESRAYDTKPIWERALAKIMGMDSEIGEIKSKVVAIEGKVVTIEGKVVATEGKVAVIETDVAALKTNYVDLKNELIDLRREKHQVNKRLDLILEFLLEDRGDIRDARDRITRLETKLA